MVFKNGLLLGSSSATITSSELKGMVETSVCLLDFPFLREQRANSRGRFVVTNQ